MATSHKFVPQLPNAGAGTSGVLFRRPEVLAVDAAFGPVFRYFDVFEQIDDFGFFANSPKGAAYSRVLQQRPSVLAAAVSDYPQRLLAFLATRGSVLAGRIGGDSKAV